MGSDGGRLLGVLPLGDDGRERCGGECACRDDLQGLLRPAESLLAGGVRDVVDLHWGVSFL